MGSYPPGTTVLSTGRSPGARGGARSRPAGASRVRGPFAGRRVSRCLRCTGGSPNAASRRFRGRRPRGRRRRCWCAARPGSASRPCCWSAAGMAAARGMRILRRPGWSRRRTCPSPVCTSCCFRSATEIEDLPGPQRDALGAAFGLTDAPVPDLFLVALAALNLLGRRPPARPSCSWSRTRTGWTAPAPTCSRSSRGGWTPSRSCCWPRSATVSRAPWTGRGCRSCSSIGSTTPPRPRCWTPVAPPGAGGARAVAAGGGGKPAGPGRAAARLGAAGAARAPLPGWLPLTTRLEQTFTARMSGLPSAPRALLLVAALNDGTALSETLDATALIIGAPVTADDLAPAVTVRLVDVDEAGVSFRHPLMRSAIYQEVEPLPAARGARRAGRRARRPAGPSPLAPRGLHPRAR